MQNENNDRPNKRNKKASQAPNPPYMHDELFTSLAFTTEDGTEVKLWAQDAIKIAMEVAEAAEQSIDPRTELVTIPNTGPTTMQDRFREESNTVLATYSREYGLLEGVLANFIGNLDSNPGAAAIFFTSCYPYLDMLRDITTNKCEVRDSLNVLKDHTVRKFLPIPEPINLQASKNLGDIRKWQSLVRALRDGPSRNDINGWWILLAGRLIHLNYNHNGTHQQFYVSDHGPLDEIYAQTEQAIFQHSYADSRANFDLAVRNFLSLYDSLDQDHKELLQLNFINEAISYNNPLDHEMMELLLFSFVFPTHLRGMVKAERSIGWYTMMYSNLVDEIPRIDTEKAESIRNNQEYSIYLNVFETTLERFRYLHAVIARPYYDFLFNEGGTVSQTQYHNVMSERDVDNYLKCRLLADTARLVRNGNRSYNSLPILYRPVNSYGNRSTGAAYTHFARDIEAYFESEGSINESQLATVMREILRGNNPVITSLPFIANLTAAWFISEAKRDKLSIMSGLILLDMIESGTTLLNADGDNWYSWRNSLVHPKHNIDNTKVKDLYNANKEDHEFGGMHPMVQTGSVEGAAKSIDSHLNIVRQKEASLILHWLYLKLYKCGVTNCRLTTKGESPLTDRTPSTLKPIKSELVIIRELLTQRISCLELMLPLQPEVASMVSAGSGVYALEEKGGQPASTHHTHISRLMAEIAESKDQLQR